MSFIRIIYNMFYDKWINRSFTINEVLKMLEFFNDLKKGKYVDKYEKQELEYSEILADKIDKNEELLPYILEVLNSKKSKQYKETVRQHRVLIHSLFHNKYQVLNQMSLIIDELESQVRMSESMKLIESPSVGGIYKNNL